MSKLREFTTGVTADTHEFIWNIKNSHMVTKNVSVLAEQKFEVEVKSSTNVRSKWRLGHQVITSNEYKMFLELLELLPSSAKIIPNVSVTLRKEKHDMTWFDAGIQIVATTPIRINQRLIADNTWKVGHTHIVDCDGTRTWKLRLELFSLEQPQSANVETSMQTFNSSFVAELQKHLSKYLNDSNTCNLTILCKDGKELRAHRDVLSARNPVFAAMLATEMSEQATGILRIDDISGQTVKILLHFLYTGELKPEWKQEDNIVEFVYAAGKYQLTTVLTMLDKVLGDEGDPSISVLLLSLTHKLSLKTAESKLLNRVLKMTSTVKSTPDLFALFDAEG